jgi:hypothetical protein
MKGLDFSEVSPMISILPNNVNGLYIPIVPRKPSMQEIQTNHLTTPATVVYLYQVGDAETYPTATDGTQHSDGGRDEPDTAGQNGSRDNNRNVR